MNKYILQLCLLTTAIAAIVGIEWYRSAYTPYIEAESIGKGVTGFDNLSNRFKMLADTKGGVYAYDILRLAVLPPNTDLHLLGHVIGDVLYTQKGIEGIADCTQDFRNACSHTIAIGALNEYGGQAALPLIDEACKKAPGGSGAYTMCYHGLGHGVFAYFGYDLEKTVTFCKKMGTASYNNQQYTECVGGSIMELMGGGGHDNQKWVASRGKYLTDDPLSPCMDGVIPGDVKNICLIYVTPELFVRAGANLGNPEPSTFSKAFSYCDAIPANKQSLRDACFGGFGKEFVGIAGSRDIRDVASFSDVAYKNVIEWCEMAGVADGTKACIKDAVASIFWGGENNPEGVFRFCSLAGDSLQISCYGYLGENIMMYTKGATQENLCNRLLSVATKDFCSKKYTAKLP